MISAAVIDKSRKAFVSQLTETETAPWWDAVVLTASNARQADRFREEIETRRREGMLPRRTTYLVVPDPDDRRVGSGSATINALGVLRERLAEWPNRVLMIHSGGDSRRLPQFSPVGKLFGRLPKGTVFDETMALSTSWAQCMGPGLLVMSGDVLLEFDSNAVDWNRPGVTGVGMRLPVEVGSQHGVYVTDEQGRVYTFLQKPSLSDVRAAGGLFADGRVAVDTGLLRFDAETTALLTELADFKSLPAMDLYEHITKGLTGQWKLAAEAGLFWRQFAKTLHGLPFHCSVVEGTFTHVGTTHHFRSVTGGGVMDSALAGKSELGPESVVLECHLDVPVRAGAGAILHGLEGIPEMVEVPENTVVHQVPVLTGDGRRGIVIRVYGVEDDPKVTAWFGRPMEETIAGLGIDADDVWPGIDPPERCLWNANLFPLAQVAVAWQCARWMMGYTGIYGAAQWRAARRMSLETSSKQADGKALAEGRGRRMHANWQATACALAKAGTDLRPMLSQVPGIATLAATGQALECFARELKKEKPTEAASQYVQASRILRRAGLEDAAMLAEDAALGCVADAVSRGVRTPDLAGKGGWGRENVKVSAPARIDLGGGWSDTPPFCLDWGGSVLNIALELNGELPIATTVRRLKEPLFRCVSGETGEWAEYSSLEELARPPQPGSALTIARVAMHMMGLPESGGLEVRTDVNLPLGSGLGTSSILGATVLKALAEIRGVPLTDHELSDLVMRLEQLMTTGGGWQDQAGGIFPGAKLLTTGPGFRQRIRVQPLGWSETRKAEWTRRTVLYYTGIRRVAKNLLRQVVCGYLAREVATVQVLHSIKTLASEMGYAMAEGDWEYLGTLLDRHWDLNQVIDPATTNAPINALLEQARPYLAGAKLAGAGGGGFLILLARSESAAVELRRALGSGVYEFKVADGGMRVEVT